jgi:hypothetical protein
MNSTPSPSADENPAIAQRKRAELIRIAIIGGVTATLSTLWMFWLLGIGR